MKISNNNAFPLPLFQLLEQGEREYSKGHARISVTELIDSPRLRVLKERYADRLSTDAMDMLWLLIGREMHKAAEGARGPGRINEERLYAEVQGWTVSGAIDIQQDLVNGGILISDFKFTSVHVVESNKREWEQQLNCYAWLVEQAKGDAVDGLEIYAIMRDWSRQSAIRDPEYPQYPVLTVPIPLWSQQQQTEYVEERVRLHQGAERERMLGRTLPYCTNEERWMRGEVWRVAKPDAKRALARCKTLEEAEELKAKNGGTEIAHLPGATVRCNSWCPVRRWCDQYQNELIPAVVAKEEILSDVI